MQPATRRRLNLAVTLRFFCLSLISVGAVAGARAQEQYVSWSFTVDGSNIHDLVSAYLVDTETSEAFASITSVPGVFNSVPYGGQASYSGQLDVGTNPVGPQLLTLICNFVDTSGNTGVAVSMPALLGGPLVTNGSTWSAFDTTTNFPLTLLPDETTTFGDLLSGNVTPIQGPFTYLTSSDPVLNQPGTLGQIVAFDGAVDGGTFQFSSPAPAPEPSSMALGALVLALARRGKRRNPR
ncbi:MAG: hypothetical protein ACYC96_01460 [Fimbriimonadaceae bacterium]